MAASSPAVPNNTSAHRTDTPPKTLRGLNKPKCQICGNVARSRCPFKSCKSCCSRDQNPCPIHVLKATATVPDKSGPSSSTPMFDQHGSEASPSGSSLRVASLRQLSNNFAQFNNVQIPLRSRKPLTKKDAAAINEWRFSKLKEYKERSIEVENEAFDRYMQNISLLEEVFPVKSISEDSVENESHASNPNPTSDESNPGMVSALKLQLRSNTMRTDNFRKRIQQIVDRELKKLQNPEVDDAVNDQSDKDEPNEGTKKAKNWKTERAAAISDLIDKLNKARNAEDLRSCLDIKSQLFNQDTTSNQTEIKDAEPSDQIPVIDLQPIKESQSSSTRLISTLEIDQETLNRVDEHFFSLEQIEDL